MKRIHLFLVYWAVPLTLIAIGCATKVRGVAPSGYVYEKEEAITPAMVEECTSKQVELYNDLCAEARECQGGEEEIGSEYCTDKAADLEGFGSLLIRNHFQGVECATEAIRSCLGLDRSL